MQKPGQTDTSGITVFGIGRYLPEISIAVLKPMELS